MIMQQEWSINGKFAVLADGRRVHYTRFLPALNAVRMWGITLDRALSELYGGEDLTVEQPFKEGPKLAFEYTRLWNEIKHQHEVA